MDYTLSSWCTITLNSSTSSVPLASESYLCGECNRETTLALAIAVASG